MNKILIVGIAGMILLSGNQLKSQDTLKPIRKSWGTELNVNPFDGSLSYNNADGQIKIRRYTGGNTVWRISATIDYKQDANSTILRYGTNPINNNEFKKSLLISIALGTEKHFNGTSRISPYLGWEVCYGHKSSEHEIDDEDYFTTVDGAWMNSQVQYNGQTYYTTNTFNEKSYWSFGANILTGFDFYMAKNFYFGYEISVGLDYIKYGIIETTRIPRLQSGNSSTLYPDSESNSWKFGPKLGNGIRIGYVF